MSFLIIILGIALNFVPVDVQSFTMTTPEKGSVEYVRQPDNGWTVATTNTINRSEVFVTGTQLKVTTQGKEMAMNLADVLGVTKDTDWKTVERLTFGRGAMQIERQTNGVNLVFHPAEPPAIHDVPQLYQVRWDQMAR